MVHFQSQSWDVDNNIDTHRGFPHLLLLSLASYFHRPCHPLHEFVCLVPTWALVLVNKWSILELVGVVAAEVEEGEGEYWWVASSTMRIQRHRYPWDSEPVWKLVAIQLAPSLPLPLCQGRRWAPSRPHPVYSSTILQCGLVRPRVPGLVLSRAGLWHTKVVNCWDSIQYNSSISTTTGSVQGW